VAESPPAKKEKSSDKKIFVVDDDESVVSMMKTALEIEGFQVRTARDGRSMLKKLPEFMPDLIISDLMMPGGGGYEVLRSLQTDPETSKIPVFLVTGSSMAESTKTMMKQESNLAEYFEKPLRAETLLRKVHKRLNTVSPSQAREGESKDGPVNFDDVF
jgi:CheY-like chemotaxis protein